MGSEYPPIFCGDDSLAAVESALGEVWDTLANDAQRSEHAALRVAIIHQLLDLVEEGVHSRDELRVRTLRHFGGGAS
jgi:hypothetical protein